MLFFIEHSTRRVHLIQDRGAKFTAAFDTVLAVAAVRIIKTPIQAPCANAIAVGGLPARAASASTGC